MFSGFQLLYFLKSVFTDSLDWEPVLHSFLSYFCFANRRRKFLIFCWHLIICTPSAEFMGNKICSQPTQRKTADRKRSDYRFFLIQNLKWFADRCCCTASICGLISFGRSPLITLSRIWFKISPMSLPSGTPKDLMSLPPIAKSFMEKHCPCAMTSSKMLYSARHLSILGCCVLFVWALMSACLTARSFLKLLSPILESQRRTALCVGAISESW